MLAWKYGDLVCDLFGEEELNLNQVVSSRRKLTIYRLQREVYFSQSRERVLSRTFPIFQSTIVHCLTIPPLLPHPREPKEILSCILD